MNISRRNFLKAAGAGALAAALPFPWSFLEAQSGKPNIIFIMADDLGYGDLGCFGQKHIKTPHLDRMCAEGMKFTDHYSGSTVCAPSRISLMTGMHMGHCENIGQKQELRPGTQTLGTVMKSAGYTTAAVGKWGLGNKTGLPNDQGFDRWYGFISQSRAHWYYPDYIWRNKEKVDMKDNPKTHEQYIHDNFTEETLGFIKENHKKPFFVYLPYTIPHAEVLVPEDSMEPYIQAFKEKDQGPQKPYRLKGYNLPRFPRAARAGQISRMDRDIGRIRKLLEDLKIDKNTLVVFTSDNGPCGAGGQDVNFFKSQGGLKGMKRSLYEGGIRVPTIAWWPGTVKPGAVTDLPSAFWDWLPTFAELGGAKLSKPTDGVSVAPTLLGNTKQKQHEYLFWDYNEKARPGKISAVRQGNWKLVWLRQAASDKPELYDLSKDKKEKSNLASKYPDKVKDLMDIMKPLLTGP